MRNRARAPRFPLSPFSPFFSLSVSICASYVQYNPICFSLHVHRHGGGNAGVLPVSENVKTQVPSGKIPTAKYNNITSHHNRHKDHKKKRDNVEGWR